MTVQSVHSAARRSERSGCTDYCASLFTACTSEVSSQLARLQATVNTTSRRHHDANTYRVGVGYSSNYHLCISLLRPNDLPSSCDAVLKRSARGMLDMRAVDNSRSA